MSPTVFSGVCVALSLAFCVMFLSFDLRLLITRLISSNLSCSNPGEYLAVLYMCLGLCVSFGESSLFNCSETSTGYISSWSRLEYRIK